MLLKKANELTLILFKGFNGHYISVLQCVDQGNAALSFRKINKGSDRGRDLHEPKARQSW